MSVVRVNPDAPEREPLQRAASLLRQGRLVAFPTETVYGLGANALDERAVQRIYEAKGRPSVNPVIVHVASTEAARALTTEWTAAADALARAYWPGPLTLVVRKSADIPAIVTAGGDTVGLRLPSHPVALALLREAGLPIAAPSANPSNRVSPTSAAHVQRGLGDRVDLILDGGDTHVGIESTVVDVTTAVPRVLRPGMISAEMIRAVCGDVSVAGHATGAEPAGAIRSPGMLPQHYAPKARVRLFGSDDRDRVAARAVQDVARGQVVGAMTFTSLRLAPLAERLMPATPAEYARALYATLHALDDAGCAQIWIEEPPATPEWAGILDRLTRASRG